MRNWMVGLVVGLSGVIGAASAEAQHEHSKSCDAVLQTPTPYVPYENKDLAWAGYYDKAAKPLMTIRKPTDTTLLEQPGVFLLVSDYDNKDCVAAHFEREVFTSRSIVRQAKHFTAVRFDRKMLGARPRLTKQLGYEGRPIIIVVGIDQKVIARFSKKVGAKSVARAIRKAILAQKTVKRAPRAAIQNVEAARKALAKRDYLTAGKRLARVLKPKAIRSATWLEAKALLVKLEQAGVAALKTLSKEKDAIKQYEALLELEETFQTVKSIRALARTRIKSLEEGPETWRLLQEHKGTQRVRAAVALAKSGKRAEARKLLKEIEREFLGLACAHKARKLQARLAD